MQLSQLNSRINATISEDIQTDLLTLRAELHNDPELSNQEYKTQEKLLAALEKCNTRWVESVGTGIIARIKGQDAGLPPVAIRGDIDALPIQEATQLPYASKNDGVMHACGHDVHASWAIGAARLLSETPAPSDVIIILQPAEEVATGAQMIMGSGKIPSNLRAIFGGHVDRRYTVGEVVLHNGAISSFSDKFRLTITGKAAHAARPKEGVNPIPIAVNIAQDIVGIGHQIGDDTNILTITEIHAGKRHNMIPESATLSGTIRCLNPKIRQSLHEALSKVAGKRDGGQIELSIDAASPAIINSAELEGVARQAIVDALGDRGCVPLNAPNMASEDFGVYLQTFPGWFFRFGAGYDGGDFIPVHVPEFYAEDEALFVGAMVLANCARLID